MSKKITFEFYMNVMDDLTVDINDRISAAQEILLYHHLRGQQDARHFLRSVISDTTPDQKPRHDLHERFRAAGLLDRAGDTND